MTPIVHTACSGLARPRQALAAALLSFVAATAQAEDKCSASGVMAGQKFTANHCAVALYPAQKSVAFWFNENEITERESETFQATAYADSASKDGKDRTMLLVLFCPGGGQASPSAAAIKSMDMEVSHASSADAGAQWMVTAGKDFKIESISGDVKAGGNLAGKITGSRKSSGKPYSWELTFDVTLPEKPSAEGMKCAK